MRQITPKAITVFSCLTVINLIGTAGLYLFLNQNINVSKNILFVAMPLFYFFSTILTYRLVFYYLGFPNYNVLKSSKEDFAFQLYVLYYLIYFNFFVHNTLLPVPLSKIFHQLLGAKFGAGSYSPGIILDPPYVEIGKNSIVGFGAVLCSHALEGENVWFDKIYIGNDVTIGLRSMIMPGVIIEDAAIVAAGALVTKNSHIKTGEVWAGIPAKRIQKSTTDIIPSIANYAS